MIRNGRIVAVVMADGGRLQIRREPGAGVAPPEPATASGAALGAVARGDEAWEEEAAANARAGHWREDKVGLLLTMTSEVADRDPCPEIPASFLDVVRIPKLVRELKKHVQEGADAVADTEEPEAPAAALQAEATYQPPVVAQRQVLASRQTWPTFAPLLAQAAWALGFQGAARKAFVADGSANNWKLQRRFFGASRPAGLRTSNGSAGCGRAGWPRSSRPWKRARPNWAGRRRTNRKRTRGGWWTGR